MSACDCSAAGRASRTSVGASVKPAVAAPHWMVADHAKATKRQARVGTQTAELGPSLGLDRLLMSLFESPIRIARAMEMITEQDRSLGISAS